MDSASLEGPVGECIAGTCTLTEQEKAGAKRNAQKALNVQTGGAQHGIRTTRGRARAR